jgi:isopropylmalate/homocitrate/citramalate synthase
MTDLSRYGSPYNWMSNTVIHSQKSDSVIINDLTLQGDAEEMAGVLISEADKIAIATHLSESGVRRMSVLGYSPCPPDEEIKTIEKILDLGLPIQFGSFVKSQHEIDIAAEIGLWGVTILVLSNEAALPRGKTGADIIDRVQQLTEYAKAKGLHTCLMAMDATRCRMEFLESVVQAAEPACDEITIADSLGVASPYGFQFLIQNVCQWTHLPIQVHCHNHSSMAVANAMGAILGGATVIHTTVNGMGEFAGLLPLEELVVALSMHLNVSTGIKFESLKSLSELVVKATGVPISLQKPVVGDRAFCIPETEEIQEALYALEEKGILKESLTYPPELVGNRLSMSIGRRCNEYTVRYNLGLRGWTAGSETIQGIIQAVREIAWSQDGYYLMSGDEFFDLIQKQGFQLEPLRAHQSAYV